MKILIAEDQDRLRTELAASLGEAGYAVDAASDGARADFLARTEQYDAIVLDLGLPKIDGLTLLRRWRDDGLATPVLVLTARNTGVTRPVVLDPRSAKVTLDGAAVRLTAHEFRVLSYLMHHRERVVPQSELTEHIYAQDFDRDSNTVEVFVARLRKKLGSGVIETVRGLGYRIREGA